MKRKNVMAVLMCTVCLAVTQASSVAVMAEETELVTEAAEEQETEDVAEAQSEADTQAEEETEPPVRPEYHALDYVTLGDYKGLVVKLEPIEVTDAEIEDEVQYDIQLAGEMVTVEDAVIEEGDTANIDYVGKIDGEAFDGGTAKGYDLQIGSNTFIDGFEDGLIGVSVGETVDLTLTFPENYGNQELAGQEVVFTVTVNEVKRAPELTDELVSTITDGEYTDITSYKDSIRAALEENKEQEKENRIMQELLTQLANTCEIKEYPQAMMDYGIENMKAAYKTYAKQYEMEYADFLSTFLGMTEEEFEEEARMAVEQNLQQELYLKAIAEAEEMEITEEEYTQAAEKYAQMYGYTSIDDLLKDYDESTVRISALQDKVMNFVRENAVVEEADAAAEEAQTEE